MKKAAQIGILILITLLLVIIVLLVGETIVRLQHGLSLNQVAIPLIAKKPIG